MRTITTGLDPDDLAHRLGVQVVEHDGGEKGRHYPGGILSIRRDLGPIARRCTLAHELAHYILRHEPTSDPWLHSRQEQQAHELAAELLITPQDYEAAETLVGHYPSALAAELGVTKHLIHVWRGIYERTTTP